MQVVLVKTSSLGDVVHNLPVVNDVRRCFPEANVDWVVERSFSAIPALHPGVRKLIPCELRRWRRSWFTRSTRKEWRAFLDQLRSIHYDAIIDTQGLLKSAIIARLAQGRRFGLDWVSSREPLRLFYDRTFRVAWGQHAVVRNRQLAVMALGYELHGEADYGIRRPSNASSLSRRPYAVLLHATSHPRKLWPEPNWVELGRQIAARGYSLILTWGSEPEQTRAQRLAERIPGAVVPPATDLSEVAGLLAGAAAVIGVDTGLTHLAAALGVPTIGLYGATDPRATGLCTSGPAINLGELGHFPAVDEVVDALRHLGAIDAAREANAGAQALRERK